jgi:hypothetical protein
MEGVCNYTPPRVYDQQYHEISKKNAYFPYQKPRKLQDQTLVSPIQTIHKKEKETPRGAHHLSSSIHL